MSAVGSAGQCGGSSEKQVGVDSFAIAQIRPGPSDGLPGGIDGFLQAAVLGGRPGLVVAVEGAHVRGRQPLVVAVAVKHHKVVLLLVRDVVEVGGAGQLHLPRPPREAHHLGPHHLTRVEARPAGAATHGSNSRLLPAAGRPPRLALHRRLPRRAFPVADAGGAARWAGPLAASGWPARRALQWPLVPGLAHPQTAGAAVLPGTRRPARLALQWRR
mmetsp:Transcript_22135/g.56737  ORF Transcript_22135/g.56737 Transcript_22135/m.56737 type:complete len:216 (-) Transcript_22135:25-672(-)